MKLELAMQAKSGTVTYRGMTLVLKYSGEGVSDALAFAANVGKDKLALSLRTSEKKKSKKGLVANVLATLKPTKLTPKPSTEHQSIDMVFDMVGPDGGEDLTRVALMLLELEECVLFVEAEQLEPPLPLD